MDSPRGPLDSAFHWSGTGGKCESEKSEREREREITREEWCASEEKRRNGKIPN